MAKRKYRLRKWRASGHARKKNKKSVAERKIAKRLIARRIRAEVKKNLSQETV